MRELPDALCTSWLAETWSGAHGAAGMRADVKATSSVTLTPAGITGSGRASGPVLLHGSPVGKVTRAVTLHGSGRLEVSHSYMNLDAAQRGTGFARSLNDRAFQRYAEVGVDDVSIHAASQVGGYAWARQGFELTGEGSTVGERLRSRGEILAKFVDYAHTSGRISDAEFAAVAPRLYRGGAIAADTLVSVRELANMPGVGKSVLLGRSWMGAQSIERLRPWWQGRGSAGVADAKAGWNYLANPAEVSREAQAVAKRVAARLPAGFDPVVVARTFERALSGVGGGAVIDASDGAATLLKVSARDTVESLETQVRLHTPSGQSIAAKVSLAADRSLAAIEEVAPELRTVGTRGALDAAWCDLGVERVYDAADRRWFTIGGSR
ncbi:MAG: hypothetical protein JWN41_67 [Thermoleophilia bacterium]|nr:hypothetical protein [Thermoleophilia bacterium]